MPAEAIFEPCYEGGKAMRWCIQQPGKTPMWRAGIYMRHPTFKARDSKPLFSFAMLTVNADGHPVFERMHKPGDEKRMVTVVDPAEYDRCLQCSVEEAHTLFKQWMGPLDAFPAPLAPRGPKPAAPPPEVDGGRF